ncbi:MAG: redoxin domain-containing protein [Aliifodinibius sp.]|nr:SCO family protein [Fodinibius sp.]NIV13630.1 redoxin domain-containing protein [Fodinibius sp.]NIY27376.1 redoxin domain-containing protein [Fodinibius sp.]
MNSEHSLYHLDAEWTDHRGDVVRLDDFKGEPVIVVMFYGNCTDVCPILIQDTWRLYSSVDESVREHVNVLAVSFDTENDTPEVLNKYAKYEQLDIPGWHFMTADDTDIRTLAMMLGVQYSKKSDGHFAHSNLVTVLDEKGRVAQRVEGLNQPMDEAKATIESIMDRLNK